MTHPSLDELSRLLEACANGPMQDSREGTGVGPWADAAIASSFRRLGIRPPPGALATMRPDPPAAERNHHAVVLLLCHLLAHDSVRPQGLSSDRFWRLFSEQGRELAKRGPAEWFVDDPLGREQLIRVMLAWIGLCPAGESEAQAVERLAAIYGSEQTQSLLEARRALEVLEALNRKWADEAADKWMRE